MVVRNIMTFVLVQTTSSFINHCCLHYQCNFEHSEKIKYCLSIIIRIVLTLCASSILDSQGSPHTTLYKPLFKNIVSTSWGQGPLFCLFMYPKLLAFSVNTKYYSLHKNKTKHWMHEFWSLSSPLLPHLQTGCVLSVFMIQFSCLWNGDNISS